MKIELDLAKFWWNYNPKSSAYAVYLGELKHWLIENEIRYRFFFKKNSTVPYRIELSEEDALLFRLRFSPC